MYLAPVQNIRFKGVTRFLSCNSEGKNRRVSDFPYGTASFGDTRGLTKLVKQYTYPNAGIEETIGKLHDNVTCKVYVAEPMEVVDDLIKLQHDYIVYDCEPTYPDIRDNYYGDTTKKEFEAVKNYLKRLEAAEVKSLQSNPKALSTRLKELRRKFKVVEECSRIYALGTSLREQKAEYERKIEAKKVRIAQIEEHLPEYERELTKEKSCIKNHQKTLPVKEATLSALKKRQTKIPPRSRMRKEKIELLNQKICYTEQKIEKIKYLLAKHIKKADFLEKFITSAPVKIDMYKKEIDEYMKKLSEINFAIEPFIKKICEVYTQNGIKIAKRI